MVNFVVQVALQGRAGKLEPAGIVFLCFITTIHLPQFLFPPSLNYKTNDKLNALFPCFYFITVEIFSDRNKFQFLFCYVADYRMPVKDRPWRISAQQY
jgi:hypothetical protein